jgi:hypothetical protein
VKLTAKKRSKMKPKEFALKGKHFPLNDKKHDRVAISGATRSYNAGNISKAEEDHVKADARKKLGKKTARKRG